MTGTIVTRKTDWALCVNGPWYPHLSNGGYLAYRIWQQFDGMRWFQRHEWAAADGTTEIEEWIPTSITEWLPTAA